jgi:hypothetical protein
MTSWLLEVIDIGGGIALSVSIILFFVALIIRYGKGKETYPSSATRLLRELNDKEMQDKIGLTVTLNGENVFITNFPVEIKKLYFRLDEANQLLLHQYRKLEDAYRYIQVAAILALVAFFVLRIMHFKY